MLEILLLLVLFMVIGAVIGVGALIRRESAAYQKFMVEHPVLGWIATVTVGGFAATIVLLMAGLFAVIILTLLGLG